MTDAVTFQQVQNGIDTGASVQIDPQLRLLDYGRDLGTFTRQDVLFQAYFVAFLVLRHHGSATQSRQSVCRFDKTKWLRHLRRTRLRRDDYVQSPVLRSIASGIKSGGLHLRHRPESGGAIVRQILTGNGNTLKGHVNDNVLNSQAVQASFNKFGDYFLRSPFRKAHRLIRLIRPATAQSPAPASPP